MQGVERGSTHPRVIAQDPKVLTLQIAALGVSHGSAYYELSALVEKYFVKLGNFTPNLTIRSICLSSHSEWCSIEDNVGAKR